MSNYSYEAVDAGGLKVEGKLEVMDQNEAIRRVKEMGLFPVRIVEERSGFGRGARFAGRGLNRLPSRGLSTLVLRPSTLFFARRRVKASVLAIFTRQLATLIEAGMPLLRGLRLLREQEEESAALKRILDEVSDQIEGGSSLSEALAAHPQVFNSLYVNMVKAGELSGALEITLRRLAEFMEKAQRIKGKVKAALFYPAAVMVVAAGILSLLMVYVIPKFRDLFAGINMPMPAFTTFVLNISEIIKRDFISVLVGISLLAMVFLAGLRTRGGRRVFDQFKLRSPVLGPVFRKLAISRFARTLGTLLANGVPILQALNIVKETTGNVVVGNVISTIHDSVKEGETIAGPLKGSRVFPAMVAGMVDIGEQTGALPDMLMKVADNYDDQVDNAVTSMTSLLEPVMIVFLAVVVGSIVIAVFLPIMRLGTDGFGGGGHD
ncbi:MAG TPA: type II secretion system F family protein [Verrucomicrobiae bacterium]|jgi:type IV pilus assembly protein PilC|nr:type II secretion system F family protein [Verrucomicrobiae bacterium]